MSSSTVLWAQAAGLTGCPVSCLLQDESVTQLGQELAQKLGLRVRKAYKRPQVGGLWALGHEVGRRMQEGSGTTGKVGEVARAG